MSDAVQGPHEVQAVVLDIEGTVGSLSHVRDVLFPYARRRLADWVAKHWNDGAYAVLWQEVRGLAGDQGLQQSSVATALVAWSDDEATPSLPALGETSRSVGLA